VADKSVAEKSVADKSVEGGYIKTTDRRPRFVGGRWSATDFYVTTSNDREKRIAILL
jgi:hypothetical protein